MTAFILTVAILGVVAMAAKVLDDQFRLRRIRREGREAAERRLEEEAACVRVREQNRSHSRKVYGY